VNSRYNRPFTTMLKILSAIATITSSRKKTSIRSSAQLNSSAAGQPPLTASARLASDPVGIKSGGQARLWIGSWHFPVMLPWIRRSPSGPDGHERCSPRIREMEAWFAVNDTTPVLLEVPEVKNRYYTA
jgi:hypothetical protein